MLSLMPQSLTHPPRRFSRQLRRWGKFWLAILNVHSWRGLNPTPAELWLLPDWAPIHPWRWWIHTRNVYIPMGYLSGKGFQCEEDDLIRSLRQVRALPKGGGADREVLTTLRTPTLTVRRNCTPNRTNRSTGPPSGTRSPPTTSTRRIRASPKRASLSSTCTTASRRASFAGRRSRGRTGSWSWRTRTRVTRPWGLSARR